MSVRERLIEKKYAKHMRDYIRGPRPKATVRFIDGRVYVGTKSGHRQPPALKIAMMNRIKGYPYSL